MSSTTSFVGGSTDSSGEAAAAERSEALAHGGRLSDLDIAKLRHPHEPSRFALALVAMAVPVAVAVFVLVSLGQATMLVAVILVIGLLLLLVWLSLQVWRIRLLGDAVLVSEETLPELQEVIDTARERLHYTRPLRVFVVDKMSKVLTVDTAPITFTQYFGIRVLIAEGAALGDLADEQDRQRLLFTIATYVGALKARYARWWSPLFTAFQMTGLTGVALPFINPYYRATVYSGDRIAYAACGDLDISLEAVYRAMVGNEVAPHLRAAGLTGQALSARRRKLLRFAQLLRPSPHATSRYLELLAFISQTAPDEFESHRSALGATSPQAGTVLASLSRRRSHDGAAAVGVMLAAIVLIAGLGVGLTARNSPVAEAFADAFGWPRSSGSGSDTHVNDAPLPTITTPDQPKPSPTPTFSTSTTTPVDPLVAGLLSRASADPSYSCTPEAVPDTGALASVTCNSQGDRPDVIRLHAYSTKTGMRAVMQEYARGLNEGQCSRGKPAHQTWSRDDTEKGPIACYRSEAGNNTIVWGSDESGVLALAYDASWTLPKIYEWWRNTPIKVD
jgi:hypothetical protein